MIDIVTCCKEHVMIAYNGDSLAEYGTDCPLCTAINTGRRYKSAAQEKNIEAQHSGGVAGEQGTANNAMVPCPFRNDTVGCPLSRDLWICGDKSCLIQRPQHQ